MDHRDRLRRAVFLAAVFLASQFTVDAARAAEAPSFSYKTTLTQVAYPSRMVEDRDGNLYVTDSRSGKVYVFDRFGSLVRLEVVSQPTSIAYDSVSGVVYVGTAKQGIFVLGESSPRISAAQAGSPADMDTDSTGNLYVVDVLSHAVKKFSCCSAGGGGVVVTHSFEGVSGVRRWYPVSIEVGPGLAGGDWGEYVYVGYSVNSGAPNNTHMVEMHDASTLEVLAGRGFGRPLLPADATTRSSGTAYASDQFSSAVAIAVDGFGRVYVGGSYSQKVAVFDEAGTVMSSFLAVPSNPMDVYYDQYGRVEVSDQNGGIQVYVVDGDVANVPPSAPNLVSPKGGAQVSATPLLKISNSTDQNGDSLVYDFEVATDVAMRNVVWSAAAISEGSVATFIAVDASANLQEDTAYYWRVRASDGIDYSRYSQTTSFFVNEINNAPLIESASVSPSVGTASAEEAADSATFNPVRFSVSGRDADAVGFAAVWSVDGVEVARNYVANGAEAVYVYQASRGTAGAHTVAVALEDVRSGTVAASGGSQSWNLLVYRYNSAPGTPGLHLPADGADVMPATDPSAALQAQTASDAEGDELGYVFEISTVSDFTDVLHSLDSDSLTESLASVSVAGAMVEENTRYYWHVKACETGDPAARGVVENRCGSWSEGRSFVVNDVNDVSTTPGLSYPGDGRSVDNVTPALQVTKSSDPDLNDVLTYEFQVATDSRFTNIVKSAAGIEGVEGDGTVSWPYEPGASVIWEGAPLNDNTKYYWRSRAVDGAGAASAWATAWFFVNTANDAPDAPGYMTVSALKNIDNEIEVTSPVALEVAEAVDLDGDALTYTFEIDVVNTFSSPVKLASTMQPGVSWTVGAPLADNTTYFWRVRAADSVSDSPWTETAAFFVNTVNDAPAAPVLKAPVEAVHVPTATPQLSVYDVSDVDGDAVSYTYEVSSDSTFASFDAGSGAGASSVWTVDKLLRENGIYYWRARTTDEHELDSVDWSDTGVFRVNMANDLPTAPVIEWQQASTNGAVILALSNSYDADGNTLDYEIEVYSDKGLTTLAGCNGGNPCRITGIEEGADGKTSVVVGRLDNGTPQGFGVYYWRARANDGIAYGGWSGTRTVTIGGGGAPDSRTDKAYGGRRF